MPTSRASEAQDLTKLAGLKLGNYRLERLIGSGRMGVVYLAKDEALLRPTAIKLLSWKAVDAKGQDPVRWFLAEARIVARINHPRVVQIYGAARQDDHCYIAMEYVVGRSAEALLAKGRLSPEAATEILVQAASALDAAHRSSVIHRDVKPANLLVGEDGVTKLGDFGMALGGPEVSAGNAHVRVGTPYYTAPEIWRGGAATPASDIYALGATYYHLLTGQPPYPAFDVASVERAHLGEKIPDPRRIVPSLPASAAALVMRALAKDPKARHESATVVLWEARRVQQELASRPGAAAPGPPQRPPPPSAAAPGLPLAPDLLREAFGFLHRPFSDVVPPGAAIGDGPVSSIRARVVGLLEEDGGAALAITGGVESGHATLCRRIANELGAQRLVVDLEAGRDPGGRTLLQRLCAAAGAPEEPTEEAGLDAFIARMGEERQRWGRAPLVLLDGIVPHAAAAGLVRLVEATRWSRTFHLLVAGPAGLSSALQRAGLDQAEPLEELPVPPLVAEQIGPYVRGWIAATLAPRAAPILLSPDALLLLALRTQGALERLDCVAENMLVLAAAERRRMLGTWHAWTASDQERWADSAPGSIPRRPASWPPPEVADVLDVCRRGAGLPPFPRVSRTGS